MIGERLGNWAIYKELGRGGMGQVYLAQEELTGRRAAVKVLSAALSQQPGFLERFHREVEALRKLDHPNIVKFYDSGEENGFYYYAMEYIDGETLQDGLDGKKRLPWQDVPQLAIQICSALKHAHDHGVVHRDLKPSNLLVTADGVVKLGDFGIAKLFASGQLTATGGIVGTAEFLSPEQASGKPATKRSDLYSFGVVLYLLVTGKTPFTGKTHLDLLHKHRYARFDAPIKVVPELPPDLDEIICRLLEKEPDKRPPDAMVLRREFEKIDQKLRRKSHLTEIAPGDDMTMAENAMRPSRRHHEGPATMMSRMVREELEQQNRGGPITQFFNQPVVLVVALVLCISGIAYAFWPLSEEQLFKRGEALMQSEYYADWEMAWNQYFEPLEQRFPDHKYQDELKEYRRQLENTRLSREFSIPSEAERFYKKGERLQSEGRFEEAKKTWKNLIVVFGGQEAEKAWVQKATSAVENLDQLEEKHDRFVSVKKSIRHAADLRSKGKTEEANAILQSIIELYSDDAQAQEIVADARKRLNQK